MRILVFQHLAVETPGVFLDLWKDEGHEWRTIELDEGEPIPDLEAYDLLAVMGGPMDVWQEEIHPWLAPEKAAIRRWVKDLDRPYLGICLGHQLLAEALGGKVSLMNKPEVGLAHVKLTAGGQRDRLLAGLPSPIETLQWHGAEVSQLPVGAEVLAGNAACPVQAIRYGRHAYGFQYHMEINAGTVADWERIPEYKASLEKALGAEARHLAGRVVPKLPAFRNVAFIIGANLSAIASDLSPQQSLYR
ncbi:MAG: type 1 glutamine amidotransferase [Methylocella sp.]